MESSVYNVEGREVRKITLPDSVFGVKWNGDLVHQVVVSMQANKRIPWAHTKTRGEVAGGGKKPWRQKGTGRARHGSIRSPIWVGGGITHGPRKDKDYSRKINKKMRAKALCAVLSKKFKDGEVLFVESLSVPSGKTKDAKAILGKLSGIKGYEKLTSKPANTALVALAAKNRNTVLGLRNFSNIRVDDVRNLNLVDALSFKYVVIADPEASLKEIAVRAAKH